MHFLNALRRITTSILTAGFIFSTAIPLAASPVMTDSPSAISFARSANGQVHMLKGHSGALTIQRTGQSLATDIANQYAPAFGIRSPASQLAVKHDVLREDNRRNIRYQQSHEGIPVIGGELIANVNAQQALTSMSGETTQIILTDVTPSVSSEQASLTALSAVSKWYKIAKNDLEVIQPQLKIYVPSLLGPGEGPQSLVWQMNIKPKGIAHFNEYVLVEAKRGSIALHFNTMHSALSLATHTANNDINVVLPGTLLCGEVDLDCNANADAAFANDYSADTYDFFLINHGRDSFDNAGGTIISTVNYPEAFSNGLSNASWNGDQALYTDGMASDDIVAHEIAHGVTQHTSALLYYYQSGAINESLSDLWGEFVDQTNNAGTDTPGVRWEMGEDSALGAIRDMSDPTRFGDPDRMTSGNYWTSPLDAGGVHTNSGINNKAVYLMVEGDSFNGQVISGIGIPKTAAIYYDVQTNYLTSGSDYFDLYNALNQSCQQLIGTNGITVDDCTQVKAALLAVEMNQEAPNVFHPEAELCPSGSVLSSSLFYDDFETNLDNWTPSNLVGDTTWLQDVGYATSGNRMVFSQGSTALLDSVFEQNTDISLPATGNHYLHFSHFFQYETAMNVNADGSVIEYSIDGGTNWIDAGNLIDNGRVYNGTLGSDNPLAGRMAFTDFSHGYNSTRINLSSLAPNSIRFRFRNTGDMGTASFGMLLDDVRIYTCETNLPPVSIAGNDQSVLANQTVNLDGSNSNDPDANAINYLWIQQSGPAISLTGATTATPSFTSPAAGGVISLALKVTDSLGVSAFDVVNIMVNGLPIANAGPDQTADISSSINLTGSGSSDPEGNALTYEWVQNSGSPVTLSNVAAANPDFTAPATVGNLSFSLTVTDDVGQVDSDIVTITVQDPANVPPPASDGGGGCTLSEHGRFDPLWILLLSLLTLLHVALRRHQQPSQPYINKG